MRNIVFPGFRGCVASGDRSRGRRGGAFVAAALAMLAVPLVASSAEAKDLVYYGGGVISNVEVIQVAWTSEVSADRKEKLSDFYKTIFGTTYLDWLQEYDTIGLSGVDGLAGSEQHIGRGSFVGAFVITPSLSATSLLGEDIEIELAAQIASGVLPKPELDDTGHVRSLYMIDFPPGYEIGSLGKSSCVNFLAYHGTMLFEGLAVPYGVHPECGESFGTTTTVHTHELVEAITDPDTGLATGLTRPMAWRQTLEDGALEITDICEPTMGIVAGYKVAKHWSNYAGACVVEVPVCDGKLAPPACRSCTAYDAGLACSGTTPVCAADGAKQGQCVACTADDASGCGGTTPLCDVKTSTCVGCLEAADCKDAAAPTCDAETRSCRGCQSDDECQSGVCDTEPDSESGQCVECVADQDCAADEACEAHACVEVSDETSAPEATGGCVVAGGAGGREERGWLFGALAALAAGWVRRAPRRAKTSARTSVARIFGRGSERHRPCAAADARRQAPRAAGRDLPA